MYVLKQVVDTLPVFETGAGREEEQDAQGGRAQLLRQLLDRNRVCFDIEHTNGNRANHLSHYLVALYRLGASEYELCDAFHRYQLRVPLIPATPSQSRVHERNWMQFRGKKEGYMDLIEFFMKELHSHGLNIVMRKYMPFLMEGVASQLFHGIIQLGYGLEVMYPPTIAEGLAYWTYCFVSLGQIREQAEQRTFSGIKDAFVILEELHNDTTFDNDTAFQQLDGLLPRMKYLPQHYASHLSKYDIRLDTVVHQEQEEEGGQQGDHNRLEELIDSFVLLTMQMFGSLGYSDFVVLHLITGMRALKVALRALPAHERTARVFALRYFWRAIVSTYIVIGRPRVQEVTDVCVDWAKLQLACRDTTDHPSKDDVMTYLACTRDPHAPQGTKQPVEASGQTQQQQEPRQQQQVKEAFGERDWLKRRGIEGDDAHLAKLVFVCLEEAREWGENEAGCFALTTAAEAVQAFSIGGWTFFVDQRSGLPERGAAPDDQQL